MSVASIALARQRHMVQVTDRTRNRAMQVWRGMDFQDLDGSWASIGPQLTQQVSTAQLVLASGSDRYTNQVSTAAGFASDRSATVPEAFTGVDGMGRTLTDTLYGAVTATKTAVGKGLGRGGSLLAGQSYLGAVVKTLIADASRGADKISATGKGYTHYVRVVGGGACSRCAILVGMRSGPTAFARHLGCQCTTAPVHVDGKGEKDLSALKGLPTSPEEYFESLSKAEQDRIFTQAGAEAIRNGADVTRVVNARRGADGIGYAGHGGAKTGDGPRGHFVKTTIGYRPDGTAVRVYTTSESTTRRGEFGRQQIRLGSTNRVRLMPESIMEIAGDDKALTQAFLRDAGYLDYVPPHGFTPDWVTRGLPEQQAADRALVNRATLRYGNFTLG
jgi:hypothetical protein